MALTPDGTKLYVANADTDSVSEIDTSAKKLVREIALSPSPPTLDAKGHYTPSVEPRAVAISPRANMLWVTGEQSSAVLGIDLSTGMVKSTIHVGSEPVGLVVAPDESALYVACSNDGTVVKIDPKTAMVTATVKLSDGTSPNGVAIQAEPWALGWSTDGATLYATHMLAPHVSVLDPATMTEKSQLSIADVAPRPSKLQAQGTARGLYDVVARPGTSGELWVPHLMLAVLTQQPDLDFESTVFPTISVWNSDGTYAARLSTQAMNVPGDKGAFSDVVSGPHALEFTPDGKYALLLDSASEDVLALDATGKVYAQLLRPIHLEGAAPDHMFEGIVISADGKHAYVDERNTSNVQALSIDTSGATIVIAPDGPVIARVANDPMPTQMRHGQFLFNTANSDLVQITQNHWVSCATCHVEGRSDAVTWRFLAGPRDTPSNAGGSSDTGFLMHTADRREVSDYWQTINEEQGGSFSTSNPEQAADLADLQAYVDFAIPAPIPPTTDPTLVAMGKQIFESGDTGCLNCHSGPAHTDSGEGNPTLSLEGKIQLHDVGTCVTTGYPDVIHNDEDGNPRIPCTPANPDPNMTYGFDVPSLRGVASSAPYFHDGSAPTIKDALLQTKGKMGNIQSLTDAQLDALVEYVRSL